MYNTITYKKIIIIACIVSILLGVLLHFAYDISSKNFIIGLFTPVNESIWEHLKLSVIPFTIFCIGFYFYTKKKFSNMLLVSFFGNLCSMFITVVLYYIGLKIFKTDNMIFNILVYVLSVITAYLVLYLGIYNECFFSETKDSSILGTCALVLLISTFIINTVSPIRLDITKDPIDKTYGIHKLV